MWKCMVDDNSPTGQSSIFWADTQIYIANRSEVRSKIANTSEVSSEIANWSKVRSDIANRGEVYGRKY